MRGSIPHSSLHEFHLLNAFAQSFPSVQMACQLLITSGKCAVLHCHPRNWAFCRDSPVVSTNAALPARDKKEATFLFVTQPALADHTLSHMAGVVVKARDGLELPCYLSLPVLPEGQVLQDSSGLGFGSGYGSDQWWLGNGVRGRLGRGTKPCVS